MEKAMPEVKTTPVVSPAAAPAPPVTQVGADKIKKAPGLSFRRLFTKSGVSPYDEIEWELRLAQITDAKGNVIFEQKDVEVPKDWSMTATNIVASKYLHGKVGTPGRETGVRQLVTRVAETIRNWGLAQGYFKTPEDGVTFHDELVPSSSANTLPSILPSGSTLAAIASSPTLTPATGTGIHKPSKLNSASPVTASRNAPPALSTL
jgi:hypothetical protein